MNRLSMCKQPCHSNNHFKCAKNHNWFRSGRFEKKHIISYIYIYIYYIHNIIYIIIYIILYNFSKCQKFETLVEFWSFQFQISNLVWAQAFSQNFEGRFPRNIQFYACIIQLSLCIQPDLCNIEFHLVQYTYMFNGTCSKCAQLIEILRSASEGQRKRSFRRKGSFGKTSLPFELIFHQHAFVRICCACMILLSLLIYWYIYIYGSTYTYPPTYLPTYIYLHLPTSTDTYLHLPTSTYIYLPLPTSTYLYLPLPTSTYLYLPLPDLPIPTHLPTYLLTSTYIYLHLPTSTDTYLHLPPSTCIYLHLPASTSICCIYLHLPASTYIYLHLPTSTYIYLHYLHLPTSTSIYLHLPTSTYTNLHLPTSTYIYPHLLTSTYIYLYLPTSTYIYLHLPTSTYIYLHLPTSTYIYLHLPTSTDIYRHLPTSTYIYLHLPTSTDIYRHLPTSTDIYRHLPTSTYIYLHLPTYRLAAGIVKHWIYASTEFQVLAASLNGDAPLEVFVVTMDCPTKTCPSQLSVQVRSNNRSSSVWLYESQPQQTSQHNAAEHQILLLLLHLLKLWRLQETMANWPDPICRIWPICHRLLQLGLCQWCCWSPAAEEGLQQLLEPFPSDFQHALDISKSSTRCIECIGAFRETVQNKME